MFCQGMSIDEIAKARELVSGTIAGHLEYYVRLGKIKVEKVVKVENLAKIRKHLEEHEYMGIFAIKAALGDDVSYADIKFVLAASEVKEESLRMDIKKGATPCSNLC